MIYSSIKALFIAEPHNSFYTSMSGKIYCGESQGTTGSLPYFVSDRVSQKPIYWFDNNGEDYLWIFKIYAKSKLEVEGYEEQLHLLYDDCALVVSGYHTMRMERTESRTMRTGNAWCSITNYRIKIDRS